MKEQAEVQREPRKADGDTVAKEIGSKSGDTWRSTIGTKDTHKRKKNAFFLT